MKTITTIVNAVPRMLLVVLVLLLCRNAVQSFNHHQGRPLVFVRRHNLPTLFGSPPSCALQPRSSPPLSPRRYRLHCLSMSAQQPQHCESKKPSKVLLVGPSFFQLVLAKHCVAAGIEPLLVCPTSKMESFTKLIANGLDSGSDEEATSVVMGKALFGLPEESDPLGTGWREGITAVVVCAEEAVISNQNFVKQVMNWDGYGDDRDAEMDGPARAILCVPMTNKISKEKSMGWMPIFNNDKNEEKMWSDLVKTWYGDDHVSGKRGECQSSVIHFGNLFGGGVDGPAELAKLGLNESMYKMSLEQYRDLRERSFDRYRLGAQILEGDEANLKPDGQDEAENKLGDDKEPFRIVGGYPEVDRTNRHTLAAAVVQALCRPVRGAFATASTSGKGGSDDGGSVPEEFTVLSRSVSALPTEQEWNDMFANPGPAVWPNPEGFVAPVSSGETVEQP